MQNTIEELIPSQEVCLRSVVYSLNVVTGKITNLNNEVLNVDGFVDYTIPEYIEDRDRYDHAHVVSREDSQYSFSDGTTEVLFQQIEAFSPSLLPSL